MTENFIQTIVREDKERGINNGQVATRFPPEPNGYLHLGHAKSIVLNFEMAKQYGGGCNLRFDDTNPLKEGLSYVLSIKEDIQWLGYLWDSLFHASDYFEKFYKCALALIDQGDAYICDLSVNQIRETRGGMTYPGTNSPFRERSTEENRRLFLAMKLARLASEKCVLRAKIDMTSPNINMRDPVLYRIIHAPHHRTKYKWCIYPTYDFAHCLADSFEGITHSLCTTEFEDHRPLYDWILDKLGVFHPRQIEFARLKVTHTITSKRQIKALIGEKTVDGWDDPRLFTLCALRRRGIPPSAIRDFCNRVGITKKDSWSSIKLFENCVREELNAKTNRKMCVVNPLKVVITNYPEGKFNNIQAKNNPLVPEAGTRDISFCRVVYIESEDFMEDPPKKFFRLSPGTRVRLKYAYHIICTRVVKDKDGGIQEIHCTYDPDTLGAQCDKDGKKVRGTIQWVSQMDKRAATFFFLTHLFNEKHPNVAGDGMVWHNEQSCQQKTGCLIEASVLADKQRLCYQFERIGYFIKDLEEYQTSGETPRFIQTLPLRESTAKIEIRKNR